MKVHIRPNAEESDAGTGIGQVVLAQYKYLPEFGIEITPDPARADVIATHTQDFGLPRIDVLHCHGLYWTGDPGSGTYHRFNHEANRRIAAAARKSRKITVPADWVAEPFRRDMRIEPSVIGHGIDIDEWTVSTETGDYVLWNKNRAADVCDPTPALELAKRGAKVISTFAPDGPLPANLTVTGRLSFAQMKPLIQGAGVYLATTKETFGIGTLEALAAGVPVLGYRWGGTADLVEHLHDGYLVQPGDVAGLFTGLAYILNDRERMSANAREKAGRYTWRAVMEDYARLYRNLAANPEPDGVAVVIPCYNYGRFLARAVESVSGQADDVIIVDDGSTDNTPQVGAELATLPNVRYVRQANSGVAAARNNGIALAEHPFIICLDADDELAPDYVKVCRDALVADRGLGIAYTGLSFLSDAGPTPYGAWPPEFDWRLQAKVNNPPANCIPSAAMFRRAVWERAGGYRQSFAPGEDAEFWTRGASMGFGARKVTERGLFWYRAHDGSASRTRKYRRIDAWLPWMRDGHYPFAAPDKYPALVRSYDPAVSVIIPVGPGHERYLPAAVESLLGQSFRAWEVIVIDDTDSKEDWSEEIRRRYPFVRTVRMATNYGAGAARNAGLDAARAPLVLFLDADDYLLPDGLRLMVQRFVGSGGRYVYGDWIVAGETKVRETPEFTSAMLAEIAPPVTVLIATEHAQQIRFDESLPTLEEWDFFGRAAEVGIVGARVAVPTFVYRMESGSRRNDPAKEKVQVKQKARFTHFAEDDDMPCGGCGSSGVSAAIVKAKQALTQPIAQASFVAVESKPGYVRLEYSGQRTGAVTYFGNGGRKYRFGNNPVDKFQDVHPDDVEKLLRTPEIRQVHREAPAGQIEPEPVETLPEPDAGLPEIERPVVPDPNDYTVKEFVADVLTDEKWGAEALVKMLKLEQAGANRKGIVEAIEALLND